MRRSLHQGSTIGAPPFSIGYLSPTLRARHYRLRSIPDAHQPAVVLATVKDKPAAPQDTPYPAALRGRAISAGRDGRMLRQGSNQKKATKPEDQMTAQCLL